jgi:hypothetical protein
MATRHHPAGDDHFSVELTVGDEEDTITTGPAFDTIGDADWYANQLLTALWNAGNDCIVVTIVSNEDVIEQELTPATAGFTEAA